MLSAAAVSRRLTVAWRAPLSLGVGVPLLLGSAPAAAAGSTGIAFGGLTTWLSLLAALWALLAPRRPGDVAGAAAVVTVAALIFAVAAWRWRGRAHGRGLFGIGLAAGIGADVGAHDRGGLVDHVGAAGHVGTDDGIAVGVASSLVVAPRRSALPAHAAFDRAQVLDAARTRFLRLQAAWDAGDVHALGHLTTPEMLQELLSVLTTRTGAASRTDVITLHAELLEVEEIGAAWLASIEFSGLIRESAEQGAVPFRELWMLASDKSGAPSWRLARQQALL